ncbi:Glucanase inhibitor protein [Phytophthora palmivora]|uniref:Glucanase inhibitor protein n=1 Tax=Phytophthora palmivora TaxID=4796 RepID=A0A2P4XN13_9STRA|nr:Glucanase inhibitor protein [Phytophthora palmivora]
MKIASTAVAVYLLFGVVSAILGGEVVPSGTKTYLAGLRKFPNSTTYCAGALISPTHVLTSAICNQGTINYVTVGAHKVNGTDSGEVIKVKSIDIHPNYNPKAAVVTWAWDYAIVTLEKPSKFSPVKLARNKSEIQKGMSLTVMGWGVVNCKDTHYPIEPRRVELEAWSNRNCSETYGLFSRSQMCAGGIVNQGTSPGDLGAPYIKENSEGDADDVLVGTNIGTSECGSDLPMVLSRVTIGLPWINSIVSGQ